MSHSFCKYWSRSSSTNATTGTDCWPKSKRGNKQSLIIYVRFQSEEKWCWVDAHVSNGGHLKEEAASQFCPAHSSHALHHLHTAQIQHQVGSGSTSAVYTWTVDTVAQLLLCNLSPDDPSMMAATSLKCSCWNGGTLNNGVNHLWHSLCIPIFFVFSLFNAFAPSDNGSQSQNPCSIHLFQDWSYICEMIPFLLGQIIVLFQDPLQWDFCCRLWFSSCNNWCKWRRSWWSAGKQSFDKLSTICMKAK